MAPELENELNRMVQHHVKRGRVNYAFADLLFWVSVVASGVATFGIGPQWIAALPAFALFVGRKYRFAERHQWHWSYQIGLRELQRQLRDQGRSVNEVSQCLGELENMMQHEFPAAELSLYPGRSQNQ